MKRDLAEELLYTREHEWARPEEGGEEVTAGITAYAQEKMGKIVFVELPETGDRVTAGDSLAVIESVKAVSDVYAPVSGLLVEVNEELEDNPELLNDDPYGKGWIARLDIDDPGELDALMSQEQYEEFVRQEEEGQ